MKYVWAVVAGFNLYAFLIAPGENELNAALALFAALVALRIDER